jgi:hypothetical protein
MDTLLGYIIKNHVSIKDITSFAEISKLVYYGVNDDIRELLDLGNAFNNLIYLGRIRYNLILSDGNNEEAVDEWEKYLPEIKTMANVDLDRIFTVLRINNPRAKSFLKDLKNALNASHAVGASSPMTAEALEVLESISTLGGASLDHSAMIKYYELINGISLKDE